MMALPVLVAPTAAQAVVGQDTPPRRVLTLDHAGGPCQAAALTRRERSASREPVIGRAGNGAVEERRAVTRCGCVERRGQVPTESVVGPVRRRL